MKSKYMLAIKVHTEENYFVEGNMVLETDGVLTEGYLERGKEIFCDSIINKKGVKCLPAKAVVYAVIPFDS